MNLAFLASFIALAVIISMNMKKQARLYKEKEQDFWAREKRANSIRKKPLDDLKYVKIPLEAFPTHLLNENDQVLECITVMESLTSQKIVNLTGWTNTDLKLEYGTSNINALTEYDQNYTVLARTLQKWADLLLEAGYSDEAAGLMEFAVSTNTDVSRTYYRLAEYYASRGRHSEIDRLRTTAKNLRSVSRDIIVKHLKENYPNVF